MATKTQKIMVSKQIHNFVGQIVRFMSKKLLAKGYIAVELQQKLDAKIDSTIIVNWAKQAFENGLTAEQTADNFIKVLQL